jgi:hypothetical protein
LKYVKIFGGCRKEGRGRVRRVLLGGRLAEQAEHRVRDLQATLRVDGPAKQARAACGDVAVHRRAHRGLTWLSAAARSWAMSWLGVAMTSICPMNVYIAIERKNMSRK